METELVFFNYDLTKTVQEIYNNYICTTIIFYIPFKACFLNKKCIVKIQTFKTQIEKKTYFLLKNWF